MHDWTPDPRRYAATRSPDLPWGYWLRKDSAVTGLLDEEGREWESLRIYFWEHRMGMPNIGSYPADAGCEVLLAMLHALMNREVESEEAVLDLFGGGWQRARHYMAWVHAQGVVDGRNVTLEGRAIARMLAATRPANAPDLAPLDFPTLQSWNGLDGGRTREERARVMAAQEALGRALRYRFVREPVANKPGIKLIGYELGANIPLTRVLWAMAFPDDYARDRLFGWLAHHLDRWQSWGELTAEEGSRALSEHLLQLRFADEPIDLV